MGAYRLYQTQKPNHDTIQHIYELNVKECGRPPNYFGTGGLEWWCIYYSINHGDLDIGDCLNLADCTPFKSCTWPPQPKSWLHKY